MPITQKLFHVTCSKMQSSRFVWCCFCNDSSLKCCSHLFRFHSFKECDAFIGYQKDTPAAVVFQATNRFKSLRDGTTDFSRSADYLGILGGIGPDELVQETEDSELWKQAVSWSVDLYQSAGWSRSQT